MKNTEGKSKRKAKNNDRKGKKEENHRQRQKDRTAVPSAALLQQYT